MKTAHFRVDFKNCESIDYGYTIVRDIKDIQMYIDQVEEDLNNPEADAKVIITTVMMTERQYDNWIKSIES